MVCWLRILAALTAFTISPAMAGGCDAVKLAQLPITLREGLPTVPVTVDGKTVVLLLDTGAETSALDATAARRLGFPSDRRLQGVSIGVGGAAVHLPVLVSRMLIGMTAIPLARLPVITLGSGLGVDGVLGVEHLSQFDLDLDMPNRTLGLYRVRRCADPAPPWPSGAIRVPGVKVEHNRMTVPVTIDDVPVTGLVDTGATVTLVLRQTAIRLGLSEPILAADPPITVNGAGAGGLPGRLHRFRALRLGPILLEQPVLLVLGRDLPPMPDGQTPDGQMPDGQMIATEVLAQDVLGQRRLWLSLETARLYVAR